MGDSRVLISGDHLHRMGMVCSLESAAEQLEDEALESLKKARLVVPCLSFLGFCWVLAGMGW